MKTLIAAVAALMISGTAFAQVGTAVKEGAKATGDTAVQAKENAQGAISGQPEKTIHKAKAKYHKAKAKSEGTAAKEAASNVVK